MAQTYGSLLLSPDVRPAWLGHRPQETQKKNRSMRTTENKKGCKCDPASTRPEPSRRHRNVVTQLTPDDLMTDACLRESKTGPDGEPNANQLNQEVTAINPSVDSMDGRG